MGKQRQRTIRSFAQRAPAENWSRFQDQAATSARAPPTLALANLHRWRTPGALFPVQTDPCRVRLNPRLNGRSAFRFYSRPREPRTATARCARSYSEFLVRFRLRALVLKLGRRWRIGPTGAPRSALVP